MTATSDVTLPVVVIDTCVSGAQTQQMVHTSAKQACETINVSSGNKLHESRTLKVRVLFLLGDWLGAPPIAVT